MTQTYQRNWLFARFTAMILIAAISAGTVLPLVWCFGGADHSAIELKVGGTASKLLDSQPLSGPIQYAAISPNDQFHPQDCVDRDAFPPAALANEPDAPVIDGIDSPTILAGESHCGLRIVATVRNTSGPTAPSASAFPALEQLKTVILLI